MNLTIENTTSIEDLVAIAIQTNKGDWWGDSTIGSTLWLLEQKGKVDSETLAQASDAILNCLEPLKDGGLITDATIQTSIIGKEGISYTVAITLPDQTTTTVKGLLQ